MEIFFVLPLKMAKLKEVQAADVESHSRPRRKLVKACRTCWLSHCKAMIALKMELSSVNTTLDFFATEKKDCTAIGIQLICSKHFLIFLYLLSTEHCFGVSQQTINVA